MRRKCAFLPLHTVGKMQVNGVIYSQHNVSVAIYLKQLMALALVKQCSPNGYVPERPFPKKAVEKVANKKKPSIPPNSMIGRFTAVLGTIALGTKFLWERPFWDDTGYVHLVVQHFLNISRNF